MFGMAAAIIAGGVATKLVGGLIEGAGRAGQQAALIEAENIREKQMTLDFRRQRREIIRNYIRAQSASVFAASAQGAMLGSGLAGAKAQGRAQAGGQLLANKQNLALGKDLFDANRAYYEASGTTSLGQGIGAIGGAILGNAGTVTRLGTFFGGGGGSPTIDANNAGNY